MGGGVLESSVKSQLKIVTTICLMKLAILCTNLFNIDEKNKTGSGIFDYVLIRELAKMKREDIDITAFASGESSLPVKVSSIDREPSSADPKILQSNKHIMFELALLSKAFSEQNKFDIYHINIGDGDLAMPFAPFVEKPIVITLHNIINEEFTRKYFSLFKERKNVFFVALSDYQKKLLPMLQYADTIYNGIEVEQFAFDPKGGDEIMWAGRCIPMKGPDIALRTARKTNRKIKMFGIIKGGYESAHENWCEQNVVREVSAGSGYSPASFSANIERQQIVEHFQKSKLFLLPTLFEEAFGLVFVESMSCGTPVVTFARGAAPEVIRDGVTGFLVNPSDDDIRGDWVVKKTGFAGLCEAVEKIYSMPEEEYARMRLACRERAVQNFSADQMAKKYVEVYKRLT